MNVSLPDDELGGIVECLSFVAEFCDAEPWSITASLGRFVGIGRSDYTSDDLRDELLCHADYLARAIGFPDADMDPGKPVPRRPRWQQ